MKNEPVKRMKDSTKKEMDFVLLVLKAVASYVCNRDYDVFVKEIWDGITTVIGERHEEEKLEALRKINQVQKEPNRRL